MNNQDIIKLTITLKSGAEFELVGTTHEAQNFHKRYKKWVGGQIHKTDNHKILCFDNTYFSADVIAVYSATNMGGKRTHLGTTY